MKKSLVTSITFLTFILFALSSHAADVSTKYRYAEKDFTGTMTIRTDGKYYSFQFNTKFPATGNECVFSVDDEPSRNAKDRSLLVSSAENGVKFKISFKGNTAKVDVLDKGSECGMTGYFGGKYVKAKK